MDVLYTPSTKQAVFLATFRQQVFPFSDSLIYYITKNPSTPKCYEKMCQTCKHFFIKNPILIVQRLHLITDHNEHKALFNDKLIDCSKLTSKIWITEKFVTSNWESKKAKFFSSIVQKIYKSNIAELEVYYQGIAYNDFKFFASKCHSIKFYSNTVMNENSIILLEKIIEIVPYLKEFVYCHNKTSSKAIGPETVPELLKIPHFRNLTDLWLSEIPEAFDINAFYSYIKENKKTKIWLHFNDEISDAYKTRLQKIVNEIIENKNHNFQVPMIIFPGKNQSSYKKLLDHFNSS